MILTATEVTIYSNISASVATIIAKQLIPIAQEKVVMKLNNYFVTDLYLQGSVTFDGSTIVSEDNFDDKNFTGSDDIYIYNSYRNDGYYTLSSVDGCTLNLASGYSVIDELSGRSVLISVVKWPLEVKSLVAQMIAYDYDIRPKMRGLTSRSLGPLSESYGTLDEDGYPKSITDGLSKYYIARVF